MGWFSRVLDWFRPVERALQPPLLLLGSDVVQQDYPPLNAMSTLASFVWVRIAADAIATDLAGLPLVAAKRTGPRPMDRELVDDPILARLERPNAGFTEYLFRKQLWVDLLLTGNAYVWAPSAVAMYRLHPQGITVRPGPLGVVSGYEWTDANGDSRVIPVDEMLHIRDVSWQDTLSQVLGESLIRSIHDELTAELGARKVAATVAAKGRPDILFAVKGLTGTGPGSSGAAEIKARWEKAISSRDGAFVVGGDVEATPLSWTPKELDYQERSNQLRDSILALFGVPPTRAGLTTASYGAARQEARIYWEGLARRAKLFDDAFSKWARPRTRVEHDLSTVEALQVSYTERLLRVSTWVGLGAKPIDAARYEGFDDAPVGESVENFVAPRPIDRQPEEPQDPKVAAAVAAYVRALSSADAIGLVDLGVERLIRAFQDAGLAEETARHWADEVAGTVGEALQVGPLDPAAVGSLFATRIGRCA